ncbi:MAG: arginine--tRNA ligase [Candidatus Aphodosoma sp.]
MSIEDIISRQTVAAVKALYNIDADEKSVQIQKTRSEFEGDITVVTFPYAKAARQSPEQTGNAIGGYLAAHADNVSHFNVVKGFLNLSINRTHWLDTLNAINADDDFGHRRASEKSPLMMIEYSSPNTNKPLHLGHVRNNLLGYSIAQIQEANGWNVVKTNIVNDRGIHICKSMLAWLKYGHGETPASTGLKGDHLVGNYYVEFDKHYKAEVKELMSNGMDEEEAKRQAPIMREAQAMLLRWEQNDPEIRALWSKMNDWVYAGFEETYRRMGVSFDRIYYESNTYLEGKSKVEEGLEKGIFYRRADGSVWANLESDGLDEKLLLRADGTSVYMTQDIGTAKLRYQDYPIDKMVYVVGNEQNYHFQVLSLLLDKLGFKWGKELVHFSYGMVELPEGKMKSREGTVVDADDLMDEMINQARETSEQMGKLSECTAEQAAEINRMVGLGALKYFILKVDPRKNMTFNPKESIDFNGNTGPFIQYTHARILSLLRNAEQQGITIMPAGDVEPSDKESSLIQKISEYPNVVRQAGTDFSPALLANYTYDLVKEYNQYYQSTSILKEEDAALRNMRLLLSKVIARTVRSAMNLLGIEMPERM